MESHVPRPRDGKDESARTDRHPSHQGPTAPVPAAPPRQLADTPASTLRNILQIIEGNRFGELFSLTSTEIAEIRGLLSAALRGIVQESAARRGILTEVIPSYQPRSVPGMDVELKDIERTNEELVGGEYSEAIAMIGTLEAQRT